MADSRALCSNTRLCLAFLSLYWLIMNSTSAEPLRANVRLGFHRRLGLIALLCCGTAAWFLYDGAIGYPRQRVRALKYQEFEEQDRLNEWRDYAQAQGWSIEYPGKPKTELDSYGQYVIAALVLPIGLFYAVEFLRYRGRWVELEGDTLRSSRGKSLTLDDVTQVDKRKWKNKGIVKLSYSGATSKFVLDDWKYDPEPTEAILRSIEAQVPADRFVGGAPEPAQAETEE